MKIREYFKGKSGLYFCIFIFMLLFLSTFYYFDKIDSYVIVLLGGIFLVFVLFILNQEIHIYNKFLFIALIFGIIFIILTPPFRVTDENVHFIRSFAISNGDIIPKSNDKGELIVSLPVSFIEMFKSIGDFTNHFDPNFRYSVYSTLNGFDFHGFSNATQEINSVANGSPFVYLPQVIAILICKLFNFPILLSVYLGRLLNLIAWGWMVYYGIKIAPISKNILLLISLTPMILHQSASLSPDAITNGISFLFICYILKLRLGKITNKGIVFLIIFSILLALIKFPYFLLLLLFFIIPKQNIGDTKKYIKAIIIIFVPGLLVFLFWNFITSGALVINKEGVDPKAQILFVLNSPFEYMKIQIFTAIKLFPFYLKSSLIGIFGGGKELPEILDIIPICMLIVGLIDNKSEVILSLKNKLFIILLFFGLVPLIFLPLYVQYSPVGFPIIDGVQGRYFIPIITLIVLVLSNIGINHNLNNLRKYVEVLVIWSLFIASLSIVQIYY